MTNPLLSPSPLPYELPPFAEIREEHYLPAFERGMAEQLAEVEAVADSPEPPTFENTVVALERSGALLRRVENVFFNQASADTNEAVQAVEAEVSPRLAAHSDAILLHRGLFGRVGALYRDRAGLGLDPESLRLLERWHDRFVRAGAQLSEAGRQRVQEINQELAAAATAFERNLLAATRDAALVVGTAEELAGLAEDAVAAAAENARELGRDGAYVLSLKNFSNQPELAVLDDRDVRRRLLEASLGRGLPENGVLAVRMARLRAERAALLGFESHAAYEVADQTAGSTGAVSDLLARLVPPAVANVGREAEALSALGDGDLEAWDWAYWSEKVRKERYDVDGAAMRPYFELDRVLRDGVFFAAEKVYGLSFTERPDLRGYHPDVRVWEVLEEDGTPLGLFLGDFFARASKRGGAWMNELVPQSRLLGQRPVVVNNHNIAKPPAGEPALLTLDEVTTLFHEFGHALHGLFSDVRYPLFSGTNVPRDFVEYPSQVNEMWALWPEVLANYARHHATGEPMPAALVERMQEAERFGQGFRTVEYLAATLLDWAWHTLPAGTDPGDAEAFEAAALEKAGVAVPAVPPRYRSGYFAHIFAGGYAAGYYSYVWSEVLDADTVEWFRENGGMRRENGDAFRRALLSRGGATDPLEAFRAFRGRAPETGPLLVRRGLA
ncbi:M3 family metallopeptidase [Streptacidiphilus sp. ASG 303]|uniref:M3 family metallopeptidase n=1 Tax=Streptacidiphilus sp. ASG 303 TaxID=2896847 RepID=UPI001E4286BE|nr:M3 family metallopeptidase [Streptacidiphilus sp. ASG 303]MCD0483424.1 M3 family metallopeptidase [Streptacidiphilus sp. ASG 303]